MKSLCCRVGTFAAAAVLAYASGASAQWKVGVQANAAQTFGSVTYDITFQDDSFGLPPVEGKSELTWPIMNPVLGGSIEVSSHALTFSGSLAGIGEASPGNLEDRDLVAGEEVVYGEAETTLDYLRLELKGTYYPKVPQLGSTVRLGATAGYCMVNLAYEGSGGFQRTFSETVYFSGKVITYDSTFQYFYLGGVLRMTPRSDTTVLLSGDLGFVGARDEDDHLLRSKKAEGSGSGLGGRAAIEVRVLVSPKVWLGGGFRAAIWNADGTQDQRFYAGPHAGIVYEGIDWSSEYRDASVWVSAGTTF